MNAGQLKHILTEVGNQIKYIRIHLYNSVYFVDHIEFDPLSRSKIFLWAVPELPVRKYKVMSFLSYLNDFRDDHEVYVCIKKGDVISHYPLSSDYSIEKEFLNFSVDVNFR